uniref:Uncharacterized protein n=1 Tax=Anopheles albimanus TaxID=7167 RepID=A0A8W7K7S1_ANOAL
MSSNEEILLETWPVHAMYGSECIVFRRPHERRPSALTILFGPSQLVSQAALSCFQATRVSISTRPSSLACRGIRSISRQSTILPVTANGIRAGRARAAKVSDHVEPDRQTVGGTADRQSPAAPGSTTASRASRVRHDAALHSDLLSSGAASTGGNPASSYSGADNARPNRKGGRELDGLKSVVTCHKLQQGSFYGTYGSSAPSSGVRLIHSNPINASLIYAFRVFPLGAY